MVNGSAALEQNRLTEAERAHDADLALACAAVRALTSAREVVHARFNVPLE